MCSERRTAHNVMRDATSQDRDVRVGDSRQYSQTSRTKPSPQQISAILASSSLTLIIHTSVDAVRMMPRPRSAKVGPVTIGACPAALHSAARNVAGGASSPLPSQNTMLEHVPQGGPGRTVVELHEQKRHVVVYQFVARRMCVEGRQQTTRNVVAGACFPVEDGLDPARVKRRVVGRYGLEDAVGEEEHAVAGRYADAMPAVGRREPDAQREI